MEIEKLTLPQLMLLWGSLDGERNRVTELINDQVLQLKATQNVGDVRATFGKGKGSYDYEAIAIGMGVDLDNLLENPYRYIVGKHTYVGPPPVKWNLVCEDIEKGEDVEGKKKFYALQKQHFTPGKEGVRLSIVKPKPATEPKQT